MREKTKKLVITFHTTAGAIAAEKFCQQRGLAGRLIPVPRSISSDCGMAWCCELSLRTVMEQALTENHMDLDGIYEAMV